MIARIGHDMEGEAVGVGFEPTNEETPLPVFKTGAFNRSATPPVSCLRSGEWYRLLGLEVGSSSRCSIRKDSCPNGQLPLFKSSCFRGVSPGIQ